MPLPMPTATADLQQPGRHAKKQRSCTAAAQQAQQVDQPSQEGIPAPALSHEDAWLLLLGQAWLYLDEDMVCRLLCCNSKMQELVHTVCRGRLPVIFEASATGRPGRHLGPVAYRLWAGPASQRAARFASWCKRHGVLLGKTLELSVWPEQEREVAAGLQQALAAADVEAAGAAHCNGSVALQTVFSMRPLSGSRRGGLLDVLQGQPLRSLQFVHHVRPGACQEQAAHDLPALASFTALRDLELTAARLDDGASGVPVYAPTSTLHNLSQLTHLVLNGYHLLPGAALPASLVSLHMLSQGHHHQSAAHAAAVQPRQSVLGDQTALQRLSLGRLHRLDVLPPRIQELRLSHGLGDSGELALRPLVQLRRLALDISAEELVLLSERGQLRVLPDLPGLELEVAVVGIRPSDRELPGEVAAAMEQLPLAQLRSLSLSCTSNHSRVPLVPVWEALCRCTQLTSLTLADCTLPVTPRLLARQLEQMPRLKDLALYRVLLKSLVTADAYSGELLDYQPLVQTLVHLRGLRRVFLKGVQLDARSAAQLAAATQLQAYVL